MSSNLTSAILRQGGIEPLSAIGPRTMARGQVEKNVRDSRHQMLQGMPDFEIVQNFVPWCILLRHWEAVFEHDG